MAAPQGVSSAFGTDALATSFSWDRLDTREDLSISGWQIRRGRTYITDTTEAGTAQADFADTEGILDVTNTSGPFTPMRPNCPFAIALHDPIAATWTTLFTGLVQQVPQTMDVSEKVCRGSIMAADLFELLGVAEVPAGLDFDNTGAGTSTANTIGDTTYAEQAVDDRIRAILADAGIPSGMTSIFSGNVNVQQCTEPAGTKILAALQDAAEAEFPGVANLYITKDGLVAFRGRLARFNPGDPTYGINTWNVGDTAAVAANSGWALIAGLTFDRDIAKVINAASVSPQNILDAQIPGQLVITSDTASIPRYGNRVYIAQDLLTAGGKTDGLRPNAETRLFGAFYAENFPDAQPRISQLTFRWVPTSAPNAAAHWAFLCGVELGDLVNVTTTHPGGGGFFEDPYFVEGISYDAKPGGGPIPDITLTLDLSHGSYFNGTDPFA